MSDMEPVTPDRALSQDEILTRLRALLQDILDLESADSIHPKARLREDLHIDSLGMLDVVIGVEETFGLKLDSDINLFERIVTVEDAVALIQDPSRSGSRRA